MMNVMKNMRMRNFALMGLVAGVVILTGCGEKIQQLKDAKDSATSAIESGKAVVDAGKEMADGGEGLVGGLRGMMKGDASLKCTTTEDDEGWVTYTNGKSFRSEGVEEGKEMNVLFVDGIMYTWDTMTKKGMQMEKKCIEDFQKNLGMDGPSVGDDFGNDFSFKNLEKEESAGKVKCVPSTSADFSIPTDVEFTDQCKIMKQQM